MSTRGVAPGYVGTGDGAETLAQAAPREHGAELARALSASRRMGRSVLA